MIRIAICCGGGFSSSALANHLEQEVREKNLSDRAEFVFIPGGRLEQRQDEVDIAMCCPHLEYKMKQNCAKDMYRIPVAIIPPRLYGLMPALDFIEDAEDLMNLWNHGAKNIVTFDDEPRPLAVKRMVSHRRHEKGEKPVL